MTLVNVNLVDAHNAFVSYIAAANQNNTDLDVLEDVCQEKVDRIAQYWDVLTKLAQACLEEQFSPLLSTLLQEWAIKEAAELLLRYQNCVIDPTHSGLQKSFWEKLGRQHQSLSSELFLLLQQSKEQRAQAERERAQNWQVVALKAFENQQNQQNQFQNAAFQWVQGQQQQNQQWFQHQREMFGSYQQANREWANVAMVGAQQAQLGVKQWYDFAASTQANVANMLAGTEQRQAAVMEQAVHKANMKKWTTRLTIIGLVLVGIVSLFGCAFFAMMRLY
ncbi:MAG TPA: hypothetical protein VFV38_10645 [Ktedonobacteraceae bacterium]|nr:hypothetical protein [Ktedonobacteraceae bacterium]